MAHIPFKLFFADFTKIDLIDLFLVKSAKTQFDIRSNTQKIQNKNEAPNFKIGASFFLWAIFIPTLRLKRI
jgi:hypothetical protein